MEFIKKYYKRITLIFVSFFIIILRFIPLSFTDTYGDGAINSYRAFGWLDWFLRSGQLTPFEWLGYIPSWGYLSFHDAPPLAFLIQHIFFVFGGNGVVTARLPFVLAGVGSILLIYFLIKKLLDTKTACLASLLYSVISYSIWAEHSMYLEGMMEFFIVGSILFLAVFIFKEKKHKYIYLSSIFVACAVITKYTAIFLIPPIIIYLWLYRKDIIVYKKQLIISTILFFLILSPVIIYNINVYQLRGHFDAALSSMVGMHPEDFSIISDRKISSDIGHNFFGLSKTLAGNMSLPLLLFSVLSIVYLIYKAIRFKRLKNFDGWIIVNLVFLILMFTFAGVADRFISIFVPFLVIIGSISVIDFWSILEKRNIKSFKVLFVIAISLLIIFELLYSINTMMLKDPIGLPYWNYSQNKLQNLGFNQLESFIRSNAIVKLPKKNPVRTKEDTTFTNKDIEGRSVVIFDDRISWFAQMWYFQRYYLYYRWPFISTAFLEALKSNQVDLNDLREVSKSKTYFIYPINDMVMDQIKVSDSKVNSLGKDLVKEFTTLEASTTIIVNRDKIPVFRIYTLETVR